MCNWRDPILLEFVPQVSKLTIVADPDALLTEEKLAIQLRDRGFDIIEFDDPIAFRYAYESKYRAIWDSGTHTDLVVILRFEGPQIDSLPFDLLTSGRKLFFSLGELFPNLSYPVIETLDRMHFDALYSAQCRYTPDRMGDNASKDFVLRHVFGIAAELITNEIELLRSLLRYHYSGLALPQSLCSRLLTVLNQNNAFKEWPLDTILFREEHFFAFLQERWPVYLKSISGEVQGVKEQDYDTELNIPGPVAIPFGHQDIRIYIDNLFLEGKLTPVAMEGVNIQNVPWVRSGLHIDNCEDNKVRTRKLFESLQNSTPTIESRYSEWLSYALKYSELLSAHHSDSTGLEPPQIQTLQSNANVAFNGWLEKNFAGLINVPPTSPAMVHHIPRALAREIESDNAKRIALIVIDGLSLEQWCSSKPIVSKQDKSLVFREHAVFAWVPTLTSISRQAIFAGKAPLYFPASIFTTDREPIHWKQFWEAYGISKLDCTYIKESSGGEIVSALDSNIVPGKTRIVGLVVTKVDRIMHGMQLGAAGMHNQVRQWCEEGHLNTILRELLDRGFEIWLTSDHGNIECKGIGRPAEGVLAETCGERVRIYSSAELQETALKKFSPSGKKWDSVGIPSELYPVFAEHGCAFTTTGELCVCHGGKSIEEAIVPLIRIERISR